MTARTSRIWFSLVILICWPTFIAGQSDSAIDIKTVARNIEERFKSCPRREVVAQFDRKHRKKIWQKQAWGPPANVFVDAKSNDSVLYPYLLTVEFTLAHSFGLERTSQEEADNDSELKLIFGELLTGKYRNTYLVGKDVIRVRSREVFSPHLDGTAGTWQERPFWPNACWDQIDIK